MTGVGRVDKTSVRADQVGNKTYVTHDIPLHQKRCAVCSMCGKMIMEKGVHITFPYI